jgi:hypothetical protein
MKRAGLQHNFTSRSNPSGEVLNTLISRSGIRDQRSGIRRQKTEKLAARRTGEGRKTLPNIHRERGRPALIHHQTSPLFRLSPASGRGVSNLSPSPACGRGAGGEGVTSSHLLDERRPCRRERELLRPEFCIYAVAGGAAPFPPERPCEDGLSRNELGESNFLCPPLCPRRGVGKAKSKP